VLTHGDFHPIPHHCAKAFYHASHIDRTTNSFGACKEYLHSDRGDLVASKLGEQFLLCRQIEVFI
jgi:hypothetical protein